jgi:hypothetical protein
VTPDDLPRLPGGPVRFADGVAIVQTATPVASLDPLVDWARVRGLELPDLVIERPSLEDVYLELTRREA